MKKLIIPIGILIMGTAQAQLTNTENYIYSKTYLSDPTLTNVKTSETVQYFDGLGRPKQIVGVKASPLGKDVVTPIKYDQFGRQVQDYLPVPQGATLNGGIITDPLANVSSTPYGSEKIYSEKILENSPLDRVLAQKQVGNAWDNKPVQFGYDANADGEVKKYTATFNYTTFTSSLTLSGSYGTGQLYKNTVTDEDGNPTIEFKNGQGQVVLVRKVISATENADTYYVYNDYNQLAYVIPPKASVEADPNTVLNDLCYQYKYDGRSRLVEKKLPGKGWEYMVYNKADQLILTQDTVLKGKGQWLFTKYDQFGRAVYTGITNNAASRASMQNSINANANLYETRTATAGLTLNGMPVYYTNLSTPTGVTQILSVNYYDTYPAGSPAVTNVFAQPLLTDDPAQERTTKGLLTASYVKNIEDDNWTRNFIWYDTKGRNIGSRSRNYLGGYTVINNKLDYTGAVLQTNTYHRRLGTDTEKIIVEKFTYDSQNRLLTHTHQIGSNPVEYLTQNKYNELSQLESKKVGGIAAASPLQTIVYQYNIRGWMTKVNDPANLNGKLFGYEMKYNNPVYTNTSTGRFNGNIAEIDWNISSAEGLKRYNYQYDALNRLLKGAYSQPNASLAQNNYFNEELSYDLNGNIKTLKRFSWPVSGGTTAEMIDDLIYNYQNGDKSNVLDKITLPAGVINNRSGYDALQGTMAYNPNGNMTDHPDRKMKISYNYLNLPNNIAVNAGIIDNSTTSYIYRADGTKVSKVYDHNGPIETNYLDGFQYDNRHAYDTAASLYTIPVLKFVPTSEGYYDFTENKYIYNYTDHLGNVRVSYRSNGSGIAEVIDANNYYPFGLKHQEGLIVPAPFGGVPYNYKYNGKELQESGMYDYGARFYMPDLGRWGVVDPLAEKMTRHSPYNYAFNNPIRFIDPDGRQGTDWYQNNLTGDYKWFDGKDQHEGYAYVDNSGTNDIDILTRGGSKSEVLGATLHPDGTVSDYNYSDNTANRGEVLITPDGTKFEAGSANIGTYWSFSANYAIGGGLGFSFGRVTDSKGETNWFSSFNGNIGFGASGGVETGVIIPTDPNHKFVTSDFAGTGVAYSGGDGPLNMSYGGTFNDTYTGYKNIDNFIPSHFGQNSKTVNSGYKTMGIGIFKGSAQALPVMWTKSKTHVYGQ
ncbi:RHS repeat-associated core domain-containing protein [Chryseobacterium viscerum]|uniref:RHS repeat-associated core domain-containing protein n=1 Tax=Chryseobacterium viscerum TaxID=1037377 RepID=UPI00222159D2|nr:RHS repeat-associated core domain-containing protein [Chryseobacterium viscerum]MCW1961003.1 RHS repeat-associated core domain-containing protein [Chryseobacterium viscerum]